MNDVFKVRFCFSSSWKAPNIPLVGVDNEFIRHRNIELNSCFILLKEKLVSIDLSSNKGYDDFLKAKNVIEELRCYRSNINYVKSDGKSYVPYTASNKGRK